jgi:hypothetical protein
MLPRPMSADATKPKGPPPLPKRAIAFPRGAMPLPARKPSVAVQVPKQGERLTQASKDAIAEMALGLLEEQVQARIVHYKADLETNPELDAITASVVAQLKELQQSVAASDRAPDSCGSIAEAQERTLAALLGRVVREDAPSLLLEKRLKDIMRRLARLFFESELHEKTRGNDGGTKVIQHGEQAVYYLLSRYENRLRTELGGFDYASDEVKARAYDLLARFAKDMQDTFLSRRSSELKRIIATFNEVLVAFFSKCLAPAVPELAREVVESARTAEGRALSYKVVADAFPRFRAAFERRVMTLLVGYAEDQLVARLADTAGASRDETVKFITDPRLFSLICGEVCEGLYEYLCNEGFLDLPADWRHLGQAALD